MGREFGVPRRHFRSTDSTNARARELADMGAPGGLVVTADEQSAGRGRQGRAWTAPPGRALLCSALLRPLQAADRLLPLAVPVAVAEAIERAGPAGTRCEIKWPNDVWICGRKVSGVLIEARPSSDWAVIGIGINVAIGPGEFPAELRETATSVGGGASVEDVLGAVCERLGNWVEAGPGTVRDAFIQRDALSGRTVAWADGSGTADGIDEEGNLLVRQRSGGLATLSAGEVHLGVEPGASFGRAGGQ
jgi:BirA family biotin operon repressor/biotin-[acetyl-CoA-carboxylase] ligase